MTFTTIEMPMQVERDNWMLDVTDDWNVSQHPECLTLELSDRGALQFSSATKKSGRVDHAELHRVAEGQNAGWGSPESVSCGVFSGFIYSYVDTEEIVWRRWFMGNEATLLFVTYNTETPISLADEKLIRSTLHTLRVHAKSV